MSSLFKKVNAATYIEAAKGKAKSQIILCDDNKRYFVKFKHNPQGQRILINELVANSIAQFLGVPCPNGALIYISQEFLDINPVLQKKFGEMPISAGWHFGTEQIRGLYPSPLPPSIFSKISNKHDLSMIIVFDILMGNSDRNNDGNFLIATSPTSPEKIHLYVIDHGHCLGGPNWNVAWLQDPIIPQPNFINEMTRLIDGIDPFKTPLTKLNNLSAVYMRSTLSEVPEEWGLTNEEKEAIAGFILERKNHVNRILQEHRNSFPLWRDKK